jgi:hypothetical protein
MAEMSLLLAAERQMYCRYVSAPASLREWMMRRWSVISVAK